jgi:hypothetical protein
MIFTREDEKEEEVECVRESWGEFTRNGNFQTKERTSIPRFLSVQRERERFLRNGLGVRYLPKQDLPKQGTYVHAYGYTCSYVFAGFAAGRSAAKGLHSHFDFDHERRDQGWCCHQLCVCV